MRLPKGLSLLVLVIVLAPLLSGCELLPEPEPPATFVPPSTATMPSGSLYTVKTGPLVDTLKVRGRVASTNEAFLFFSREGWLKTVNIKAGDQVSKGDLVAELNDPELNREVADAEYNLNKSNLELAQVSESGVEKAQLAVEKERATLDRINVDLEAANETVARRKTLKDRAYSSYQAISWKQDKESLAALDVLEQREMDYNEAVSKVKGLEADKKVSAAEVARLEKDVQIAQESLKDDTALLSQDVAYRQQLLDLTRAKLNETRIAAPFSGVILSVDAKLGDKINPFEPIGVIVDPSNLQVEVNVAEADAANVSVGEAASITLDAYPQTKLAGKIREIADKTSMWQGKSVYKVTIEFNEADRVRAAVRMGVDVSIATRTKENALLIPVKAVYTDGAEKYVDVVNQGKPEKVRIETGVSDGNQTEVVSGLNAGQVIKMP